MDRVKEATYAYRWVILFATVFSHVASAYNYHGISPLAPFIKQDLSLAHVQVGLLVSAFSFGSFIMGVPSGAMVDFIGARWMLLTGHIVLGIFTILTSYVATFTVAMFLLLIAGFGYSTINPSTAKVVMSWFSAKERATSMGVKQAGVTIGAMIAASTLPALALYLNWHLALQIVGVVAILSGILVFVLYRDYPQKAGSREYLRPNLRAFRELFFSRSIWQLGFIGLILCGIQFSLVTYLILYLRDVLHIFVISAGACLASVQIGGTIGRIFFGILSDRFFHGRRKPVVICLEITSAFLFALIWLIPVNTPLWMLLVFSGIFGLAAWGWNAIFITLSGEFAGEEQAGLAVGLYLSYVFLGGLLIPPLFGYVVDITGSYVLAWLSQSILAIIALILTLLLREEKKRAD